MAVSKIKAPTHGELIEPEMWQQYEWEQVGRMVIAEVTMYNTNPRRFADLPPLSNKFVSGIGCILRDTSTGAAITAVGYSESSGGVTLVANGLSSGHVYIGTLCYLTD